MSSEKEKSKLKEIIATTAAIATIIGTVYTLYPNYKSTFASSSQQINEKKENPGLGDVSVKSVNKLSERTYQGWNYNLPKEVEAIMSDDTKQILPIKWNINKVDTSVVKKLTYYGDVQGYNEKVVLYLTISEPYLTDILKPYSRTDGYGDTALGEGFIYINEPVTFGNNTYLKTIKAECTSHSDWKITYDLGAEYKKIILDVVVDLNDSGFKIEGDDQTLWQKNLKGNDLPKNIIIDVTGVKKLTISGYGNWWIINPKIYK